MTTAVSIIVGVLLITLLVFQVIKMVRSIRKMRAEKRAKVETCDNSKSDKGGE